MVMPPCGTFDYFVVVPDQPRECSDPWRIQAQVREPVQVTGEPLADSRLVGLCPTLEVTGGLVALRAPHRQHAQVAAASFEVDPALPSVFLPEDVLHLVRTRTADLAVSVIRQGELVVAIGAVSTVPLGRAVKISSMPFTTTDSVDVTVQEEMRRLQTGDRIQFAGYDVFVERCFVEGTPGQYECLSVALVSSCSPDVAIRSARLWARYNGGLRMVDW